MSNREQLFVTIGLLLAGTMVAIRDGDTGEAMFLALCFVVVSWFVRVTRGAPK